jgi:hypothetical protein
MHCFERMENVGGNAEKLEQGSEVRREQEIYPVMWVRRSGDWVRRSGDCVRR